MRRLCMFGGLSLAAFGAFLVLMLYGFGTMMGPDIQGTAREVTIWRGVVCEPMFYAGVVLIVVGGWLMVHDPTRSHRLGAIVGGVAGPREQPAGPGARAEQRWTLGRCMVIIAMIGLMLAVARLFVRWPALW
jgi:hypothetical protein